MANRSARKWLFAQQNDGTVLSVTFVGAGASAPTNGEGDPNALWLTMAYVGVGQYTLTTVDPWAAIVSCDATLGVATIANSWTVCFGIPSQNATTKVWSIPIQIFEGGVAADVIASDLLFVQLLVRNSILTP